MPAKIIKLKNQKYFCAAYAGKDKNGKRIVVSITDPSYQEVKRQRDAIEVNRNRKNNYLQWTLGESIDKHIENLKDYLSPTTIREYKQERKNRFSGIMDTPLFKLTSDIIQKEIDKEKHIVSAKTVKNVYGLISGTLSEFYPALNIHVKLPSVKMTKIYIPTEDEIITLFNAAKNTPLEFPLVMAACYALRRGEIVGLRWDRIDFSNKIITIDTNIVRGENNVKIVKGPKSDAGIRQLALFGAVEEVIMRQPHNGEYITNLTGDAIYNRFSKLLKKLKIPHFKFHALRHYNASVMHWLHMPDEYAMERMGHSSVVMFHKYRHTLDDKARQEDQKINQYFSELLSEKS